MTLHAPRAAAITTTVAFAAANAAAFAIAFGAALPARAQSPAAALLAPLGDRSAWAEALLPGQRAPATRFAVETLDGTVALRVDSPGSYGNLVHRVGPEGAQARTLQWRWRLDRAPAGADLRTKAGDDVALKVCVLFDLPLARVPFIERQLLRLARARSGQPLPAATLCYAWAPPHPVGTLQPNAYTARLRWLVLQGDGSPLGSWRSEQRDLQADFLRAFGNESASMPAILAIAVGGDADNTGGHGLGHLTALELRP